MEKRNFIALKQKLPYIFLNSNFLPTLCKDTKAPFWDFSFESFEMLHRREPPPGLPPAQPTLQHPQTAAPCPWPLYGRVTPAKVNFQVIAPHHHFC